MQVDLPPGTTARREYAAALELPGQTVVTPWTGDRRLVDDVLDNDLPVVGLARWVYETPAEPLTDAY